MINKSILLLVLVFFSCKNTTKTQVETQNDFAKHYIIKDFKKFKILKIIEPWKGAKTFSYILAKDKNYVPDSLQNIAFIKIPVNRIVVTSTTHLSGLEMLDETKKLVGFPNIKYISSSVFQKRFKDGDLMEIGNGAGLNTEKTLLLKPDLILAFSSGRDQLKYSIFSKNDIPVLYNADWMENNPLGRAEWIKIFGILFDKQQQATKIFEQIKSNYNKIRNRIKSDSKKPLVFQGGVFGDKWFVPGSKSYAVKLIEDAGGKYVWSDNNTASVSLNFENVLMKLPKADIWLNPGSIVSKTALINILPQAQNFNCYKNNKIFTYALVRGKTGGLLYFETSPMHPDRVLDDLYHIFYPDSINKYTFHYYSYLLP